LIGGIHFSVLFDIDRKVGKGKSPTNGTLSDRVIEHCSARATGNANEHAQKPIKECETERGIPDGDLRLKAVENRE
jgi:hypothetical protein